MPIRGMEDKRRRDKEELKELAFIDDLTELYNRRYLYQYLPVELKDMQQLGKTLCLFMLDVDTFKQINDAYGHLCGDKILLKIAEILRQSLREGDTIVRFAGDEFIAVLPGAEEAAAMDIAQRIINKIDKTSFQESKDNTNIHVTISIGLAIFPRDAQDPETLIHQADRALYSAKRSGRNRISTTKDIPLELLSETRFEEILPAPKLIGRQEQLHKLNALLAEVEIGETKFVLIKGERGIGKTRLANELKKYAQIKGITNISVTCSPENSGQAYQILITALDGLFTLLGPEVREFIRSLPEAQTKQLANYIPTLREFLPKEVKELKASSGEQAQIDLFKGICQSLIYIVKRNAFLLIIDDFHWIDKETLKLFNYMTKELRNIPLFILGAYREEELENRSDSPLLKELFQEMRQHQLVNEVALGPLEKAQILEMITTIFSDIKLPLEFVDIVYDVSAGNPLFTEEVLRSLINKGLITYQDGKWHAREITAETLPPFLKEAIQKRLTELDEETKPVVAAAAVIGQVFDFDVLCQVLNKDPGYVLEVIDRASKQHLIMPESPFQTDKFKFNSEAIRDVIYNSLDSVKKQDLHRSLALIEERIYKDNIDSVAGSLGYHFDKAQDSEKAGLYANMLLEKASRMPTYEDIFSFIQEALLEKVEAITVPLSDAGMKLVPAMVRSLRLATQNIRLYPAQSSIRAGFVNQAYKYLSEILVKDSHLIIGTAEGRLLINGEEISEKVARQAGAGVFVALMIEQRIKGITFKQDLTKEHLVIFLEGLGQNYDELIPQGGLSAVLRKKGVTLVKVNEIRYEQTSKLAKQRTQLEDAMLIDYLIGKVANVEGNKTEIFTRVATDPQRLAGALRQITEQASAKKGEGQTQTNIIAESVQKLNEQVLNQTKVGIKQYQKNFAQAMMTLDYNIRAKLIHSQVMNSDKKTELKDILGDVIKEITDEEILKMVAKEFTESGANLANLRTFLYRFIYDAQRRQKLAPKLKTELQKLGLTEEESTWVLGENLWQGLPLKEKAVRLKRLPPEHYIKLEISKEVEKIVSELLENGHYDEAGEIIDKLNKQLEGEAKKLRLTTIKDLIKISAMLIFKEKYFLLEQIITSLVQRLDKEKDPEVYSSLAQSLADICAKLIEKQNFIQATGILREFNLRLEKTSKLLDIQKEALSSAKNKTIASSSVVNRLTKLLEEKFAGRLDFWELSKVIIEIGPAVIGPLFTLALGKEPYFDPFKTYALRWGIAKVLKGLGDEVVFYLKDKLADENVQDNRVALELLGHMQNNKAVKYLYPLLHHEDLNIRKEAIATLGKIGGQEAIKMLAETIEDRNSQIRLALIWALANIGGQEVLPLLKPLLQEKEFASEVKRIIQRIERK